MKPSPTRDKTATRPPGDELLSMLAQYDLKVGELGLALRDLVLQEAPSANEILYQSYAVSMIYSFTERWTQGFCYISVYKRHVNLGFHRGAELNDPKELLVGDGKIMRHLKIESPDDLKQPYLRKFIRASIKRAREIESLKKASRPPSSRKPKR
jgi:hypothetical protein